MIKTEAAFLNLKEAAHLLGVSEATVLQLALEGKLPISRMSPGSGIQILFLKDDLLEFEQQYSEL